MVARKKEVSTAAKDTREVRRQGVEPGLYASLSTPATCGAEQGWCSPLPTVSRRHGSRPASVMRTRCTACDYRLGVRELPQQPRSYCTWLCLCILFTAPVMFSK